MRVLFVTSEAYPLIKTGGLADVSGALPPALQSLGVDVRVLMPAYPAALDAAAKKGKPVSLGDPFGLGEARLIEARMPDSGQPLWLLDCPPLYARSGGPYQDERGVDWPDNHLRFGLLSWAGAALGHGTGAIGWRPDVVSIHDWQAGLVPAYLRDWGGARPPVVLTIHNIAYQGLYDANVLPELRLPWHMFSMEGLEFYGRMSFLKAGAYYADKITTVSPTYAREIQSGPQGCGLEGLLAARSSDLVGILNGVDESVWNPEKDPHLARPFKAGDRDGKLANKLALQAEMGLPQAADVPLLIIVSRLNWHKGMDLVLSAMPSILAQGAQLALLGTGDAWLEEGFTRLARAHPRQVAAHIGYSEGLAHRLQAGGDILLMPSRSEPCGLTQFYAFRYGTVPLVHRAGGLADTVVDATYDTLASGVATGFVFDQPTVAGLQWCVERALAMYRRPDQWQGIRSAGIAQDFGWRRSAARYRDLFSELVAGTGEGERLF